MQQEKNRHTGGFTWKIKGLYLRLIRGFSLFWRSQISFIKWEIPHNDSIRRTISSIGKMALA